MDDIQPSNCYCCLPLKAGVLIGILYGLTSASLALYSMNSPTYYYPELVNERFYLFNLPNSDIILDGTCLLRIAMHLVGLFACYYNSQQLLQAYIYIKSAAVAHSPYIMYNIVVSVLYEGEEEFQDTALTRGPMTRRKMIKLGIFATVCLLLMAVYLGIEIYGIRVIARFKRLLQSKDKATREKLIL